MRWRIWYADGSTVDGEGEPEHRSVPRRQIIAIGQPDHTQGIGHVGYRLLNCYDYYFWCEVDGRWFGAVGPSSFEEQIFDRRPVREPLRGIRISDAEYEVILARAEAWAREQGFAPKDGKHRMESPP